jgi:hypothetical protein
MEQEVENLAGDNLQTRMKLLREKYKRARSRMKMDRWREHAYAKHYKIEVYDKVFVDKEATMEMLTKGILAENDERLVIAAQDQALRTNWFRKNIEGDNNISEMCRLCKAKPETVGHIIAGCETLLHRGSYTERHNSVCALIHYRLCKKYGINLEANNHWAYTPAPIQENNEVLILYDVGIPTAIFVPNNRPDIVVKDKIEEKCYMIEVGVPNDRNIAAYETEKLQKYERLKYEVRRMWQMEVIVIPVVIGALGAVMKSVPKYLKMLPIRVTSLELCREAVWKSIKILRSMLGIQNV